MASHLENRRVLLGMPGYGMVSAGAARGFWRASAYANSVHWQYQEGSLLACNFNFIWCVALNMMRQGKVFDYFAMQHADIEPEDFWLDMLIEEMESRQLDVLGVAVPIKDNRGLTSIALGAKDGNTWRPHSRLTMTEIYRLPETFTSEDVGYPLLLNTGLWVCRFDPSWVRKVRFTINDRIIEDTRRGLYMPEVEPEDWYFSRLLHELGLKIGCTRKIKVSHYGSMRFLNTHPWGNEFDTEYTSKSVVPAADGFDFKFPHDVEGWLDYEEGKALYELARGKQVLEIGSYCGVSTICMAQTAQRVVSIDPHDGRDTPNPKNTFPTFCKNLERYEVSEKVESYFDLADSPTCKYDLIFIDGAHDFDSVKRDIEMTRPLLADDGLFAFHDYGKSHPDVVAAVNGLLADGGELINVHDTLAVVRPLALVPLEA